MTFLNCLVACKAAVFSSAPRSNNFHTFFLLNFSHLVTNSIFVIPLSPQKASPSRECSIHLICGAGTGTALMKILLDEGYSVTAGVLNVLDTDFETAQFLKIPVATEAPFSPITEKTHKANLEMISKASIVILTSVPFGYSNLQNLEAALDALEREIPLIVIEEVPVAKVHFGS